MEKEKNSSWKEGVNKPRFSELTKDLEADVVVVGAGLAGVLNAYKLAQDGKKVIVLEAETVGSGATEYTTAFITQDVDTDFPELIKLFGEQSARLVWQSGADAIDFIENLINTEKIDCDFVRTDVVAYANNDKQLEALRKNQRELSQAGFDVGEIIEPNDLNFENSGYYRIHNQAKFHPLKFLAGVVESAVRLGVEFYENSEVKKIQHRRQRVLVQTKGHTVTAEAVVIATYQPFHNRLRLFLKRGMYRSFVLEARIQKNLIPEGMYLDLDNPYHYFRIDPKSGYDRVILGGEDVKSMIKVNSAKNFLALENYLKNILHGVEFETVREWSGPILEPSDGLALIGETYDNEYVATAFSGNGMTYSAISAGLISDLVMGRKNVYAKLYDPQRIPSLKQLFLKGGDYADEFFGSAGKNLIRRKQPGQY